MKLSLILKPINVLPKLATNTVEEVFKWKRKKENALKAAKCQ